MTIITRDNAQEQFVHGWAACASDIGLPVGEWPASIPTTLGNRQPFLRVRIEREGDEVWAVHYRQALGCISLAIFND